MSDNPEIHRKRLGASGKIAVFFFHIVQYLLYFPGIVTEDQHVVLYGIQEAYFSVNQICLIG